MRKDLLALGAAVAMSTAVFTTPTPASAQAWVAPVVIGSVVAGGLVGAAIASQPYYPCYRPRGLFSSGYCGCIPSYCPECVVSGYTYPPRVFYRGYAGPYYARPYYRPYIRTYHHRYYARRYYGHHWRYSRPYRYSYAAHHVRHPAYVRTRYHSNYWH